jgi:excisionase family DNA binding protein
MSDYLSVPEAAHYMNTSVRFVRRLVNERRIRFYKVGRLVRFKRADLDVFIDSGRVDPIMTGTVWREIGGKV